MALDARLWQVSDSADNAQLGQISGGANQTWLGYPVIRMMGLPKCRTRSLVDVELGGYRDGECDLALPLARSMGSDMLVMADRGIHSRALLSSWMEAGAHLLVRVVAQVGCTPVTVLPDGTYLARYGCCSGATNGQCGTSLLLRFIASRVDDGEVIKLVTSLTDHDRWLAEELAGRYG